MHKNEKIYEKFLNKLDSMDSGSIQAYLNIFLKERDYFETIFNTIHEGIIVVDKNLRIKFFNRAAKEMLGLPDDLSRLRISNFLKDIKDIEWKSLLREIASEKTLRREVEILYPAQRTLQIYLVPHKEFPDNTLVILGDITESVRQTQSQIESEKLHIVSLLAAGVAHEIGNPLNSLSLNLQYLRRMITGGTLDKDEALESIDVARVEVERLNRIIIQFLQAVRPSKPKMSDLDLREIVEEALAFMEREICDRNVSVECEWPGDAPTRISGDPSQLKQAFYNLLKNSLQAMPQGGKIRISSSVGDENVRLEFADTGVGIKPEQMAHIFETYYTTKKDGSGLGLMIVERILREHGATLSVESAPDRGAVFAMTFPRPGRRVRVLPPPADDIQADDGSCRAGA